MSRKMNKGRQGFTLIEILIVVAIIAILASVVLIGLGPTQQAGRDARRLSDLREVQNGLELYFNKCGYYPGAAESASCAGVAYGPNNFWGDPTVTPQTGMMGALVGSTIGVSTVPDDPQSGKTYYYGANGTGSGYVVAAMLENNQNSVFNTYTAPDVTAYSQVGGKTDAAGITTCAPTAALPVYCITL